ncbi:hypothetical protein TRV_04421, partial [Trichophyton verrucosum HKI 0517]
MRKAARVLCWRKEEENIDRPACRFRFLDEVEECPSIYPRETSLSLDEDSVLAEEEKTIGPTVATSSLLPFPEDFIVHQ